MSSIAASNQERTNRWLLIGAGVLALIAPIMSTAQEVPKDWGWALEGAKQSQQREVYNESETHRIYRCFMEILRRQRELLADPPVVDNQLGQPKTTSEPLSKCTEQRRAK
jgi:hypothetical protein